MALTRTSGPGLVPGFIGTLALIAGCSFSQGPDWPPLQDRAALAEEEPADAGQRLSLAELVAGRAAPPSAGGGARLVGRVRPLAVVRFGATPADYEAALYTVVRSALERRPSTAFDLVAVTPLSQTAEQVALTGQVASVFRALTAMGLPVERLSLSAVTAPGVEVNEVHIYVR